jgi:hypothetical protein
VQTAIELAFADGSYTFDLGLAQINEIQNKCGAGIGQIYSRVLKGRYVMGDVAIGNPLEAEYRVEDLLNVIRQGLIGGGKSVVDGEELPVSAHRANQLIETYVATAPLREAWTLAAAILTARIEGYTPPEGEKRKRPPAQKKRAGRRARAGSTTQAPSPTAP